MRNKLLGLEYPQQLNAWLDQELTEDYDGLPVVLNDANRLDCLYRRWVNDDSNDDCAGLRENQQVLELLDAHITFLYPTHTITDKGRLKMLYLLIRRGEMRLLQHRLDEI